MRWFLPWLLSQRCSQWTQNWVNVCKDQNGRKKIGRRPGRKNPWKVHWEYHSQAAASPKVWTLIPYLILTAVCLLLLVISWGKFSTPCIQASVRLECLRNRRLRGNEIAAREPGPRWNSAGTQGMWVWNCRQLHVTPATQASAEFITVCSQDGVGGLEFR